MLQFVTNKPEILQIGIFFKRQTGYFCDGRKNGTFYFIFLSQCLAKRWNFGYNEYIWM